MASTAPTPISVRVARPRILFVDDEPQLLKSLAATLRKQFEVVTAGSAEEAFAILENDSGFQVVVSDYRMPRKHGGVFLAEVRERFPAIVRILMSGAGAGGDLTQDTELVFRFLSKPCARATLVGAIEESVVRCEVQNQRGMARGIEY